MADVGTGISVTFGTSSFSASITAVNGEDVTRAVLDTSHHGLAANAARKKIPGDLIDHAGFTMEILYDPDAQPPIAGAAETITITFPVPSGLTNGATLAGTGFVDSWSWGAPLEELMTATVHCMWDGGTGPTWTDAS